MVLTADFTKYVERERKARQPQIQTFLATLVQLKGEKKIKGLCVDTLANLKDKHDSPNTLASYVTSYRNSIRKLQAEIELTDTNSYESPNGKKRDMHDGRIHYALKWLNLPSEVHVKRNEETKAKTKQQRTQGQPFDPFKAIDVAQDALTSTSYLEIAAAVEFLIGRRPTEVLKGKGFKLVGKYEIEFSGQLKKREGEVKPYTILTLCEASRVIDALTKLKRDADLKELDGESNLDYERRRNSPLNAAVRRIYKGVLKPPYGEKHLSNKNLRAAYTQAAAVLFKDPQESMSHFAERLLGHGNVNATISYEDYVCLDENGEEMARGQRRSELGEAPSKPKSKQRTTIHADGLLKDRFDGYQPELTHKARLSALLDAAEENARLKSQIEELERRLSKAHEALDSAQPDTNTNGKTDWSEVPSEELKGSHAPGSAEEKIRRAVAAILKFNDGKPVEAMYRLSEANVRYVSGSRHGTVKEYFKAHPELNEYNDGYGFSMQHDRGKTPVAEVIGW